jgi:endoglycosylceramidase
LAGRTLAGQGPRYRRRVLRRSLLPLAPFLIVAACGDGSSPSETPDAAPPQSRGVPLWSDGKNLRDAEGRVVVLRGVNARVEGVFDVSFDGDGTGRGPLEEIPALTADDCRRMRELGIDLVRLPINWSGIEPVRDQWDEAYLQRVDAAVDCIADAGVLVLVDLHQDAYSKEFGEDGAPLWAIIPAPTAEQRLGPPLDDLAERRLSGPVQAAFRSFFALGDPHGLQAEFIAMLSMVSARYASHPSVIGIEIFNEPNDGQAEVDAFSAKASAAVRAAAPDKLAFFEPPDIRNIVDSVVPSLVPFAVDGAVYSPHVYTCVFSGCPNGVSRETLEPSVAAARDEADAWKTPLFIGEFGNGPTADNDLYMGVQAELHDKYLASNAFWLWKEQSQGRWGLHDFDGTTWTERPVVTRWISRIHAPRIGGDPVRVDYDWETETLELEIRAGSATAAPHVVYVPERHAAAFTVTCDGAALTPARDASSGQIQVACPGVLRVAPGA